MSVIEAFNDNDNVVPEEVSRAFVADLASLAAHLPAEAQARLMGFVHLGIDPHSIEAELSISPCGTVSLVLRHPGPSREIAWPEAGFRLSPKP